VQYAKSLMTDIFDCDEVGELKDYVGCKIDYDREDRSMKITQPVLLQSYKDEFELPEGTDPKTPAAPGSMLHKGLPGEELSEKRQTIYRSGVGKLLHMMKWSRPELLNPVRELSRFMVGGTETHELAMYRTMKYCLATPNRGLFLKPNCEWNGEQDFEFTISGRADSDYAKDIDTRKSVGGSRTFLNGAPVTLRSSMQKCVTLSVTEAEFCVWNNVRSRHAI
jgi:hypothetical protein